MPTIEFDTSQWDLTLAQLEALYQAAEQQILVPTATAVGLELQKIAQNHYPPRPRPLPQAQYWTARQSRFWWWVMSQKAKDGGRSLPPLVRQQFIGWTARYVDSDEGRELVLSGSYKRTNQLVRTFNYDVVLSGDIVTTRFGTNVPYAKVVIGNDDEQAEYHKGNWTQLDQLIADNDEVLEATALRVAQKRIDQYLESLNG